MRLETILEHLIGEVPEAIGAILCDFEGEMVATAIGAIPPDAEANALNHVPKKIAKRSRPPRSAGEFLIRLAGAEPCAVLRMVDQHGRKRGAGAVRSFGVRYERVEVLVDSLPCDYYLVLVLRRPVLASHARIRMQNATSQLAEYVG